MQWPYASASTSPTPKSALPVTLDGALAGDSVTISLSDLPAAK